MAVRPKILFVGEDADTLAALRRRLWRKCAIEGAEGPLRAMEAVTGKGPYAVIVADLRLPGISGAEFFARLKKACPDTVRIMLTAHVDPQGAMEAINTGNVFRLLPRPCPEDTLEEALTAGMAQYLQVTSEKEFLKRSLRGIIKVLTDLLALLNPEAMGRAMRVKRLVADMARFGEAPDQWRIELAVILSQLGGMVMPESLFATLRSQGGLGGAAEELFARHPAIGADLLENIPRLGEVADIIRHQDTPFAGDGTGGPSGEALPLGSRLLKAALDYDRLLTSGTPREEALTALAARQGIYDPGALEMLGILAGSREGYSRDEIPATELGAGMVLEEALCLASGEKVAEVGQRVDARLLERLRGLDLAREEPVRVLVPITENQPSGLADPELLALLRRVRGTVPDI